MQYLSRPIGSLWYCQTSDTTTDIKQTWNSLCSSPMVQKAIFKTEHIMWKLKMLNQTHSTSNVVACEQALYLRKGWKNRERRGKGEEPVDKPLRTPFRGTRWCKLMQALIGENTNCWQVWLTSPFWSARSTRFKLIARKQVFKSLTWCLLADWLMKFSKKRWAIQ